MVLKWYDREFHCYLKNVDTELIVTIYLNVLFAVMLEHASILHVHLCTITVYLNKKNQPDLHCFGFSLLFSLDQRALCSHVTFLYFLG